MVNCIRLCRQKTQISIFLVLFTTLFMPTMAMGCLLFLNAVMLILLVAAIPKVKGSNTQNYKNQGNNKNAHTIGVLPEAGCVMTAMRFVLHFLS